MPHSLPLPAAAAEQAAADGFDAQLEHMSVMVQQLDQGFSAPVGTTAQSKGTISSSVGQEDRRSSGRVGDMSRQR